MQGRTVPRPTTTGACRLSPPVAGCAVVLVLVDDASSAIVAACGDPTERRENALLSKTDDDDDDEDLPFASYHAPPLPPSLPPSSRLNIVIIGSELPCMARSNFVADASSRTTSFRTRRR